MFAVLWYRHIFSLALPDSVSSAVAFGVKLVGVGKTQTVRSVFLIGTVQANRPLPFFASDLNIWKLPKNKQETYNTRYKCEPVYDLG